jgi:histidine ammonia-lyase
MKFLEINTDLRLRDISFFLEHKPKIKIGESALNKIKRCRDWLDQRLADTDEPVYGINTGFGSLCNIIIPHEDIRQLQKNLMLSHACGVGEEVPHEIVRIMLLLKLQNLCYGHSGVQQETALRIVDFLNHDILPVVYDQGSLGASGDLAPLAHLCLPLIGMGEVYFQGKKMQASDALKMSGLNPVSLQSKEGLALLNGTQFMQAYGVFSVIEAQKLNDWADFIGALSLDAYDGMLDAFNMLVHELRPHQGQIETAARVLKILKDSEIANQNKSHVQDPYSFRCIPQVHGASRDAIEYVVKVHETEMNSVTDNPTLFPDDDYIVSAGNFHGQPLALALDFLAIAMAELGSISERRIYRLIEGERGLPGFLVANPGLNSGFMIPQYSAASVVSYNKTLCHSASVDTIESSQGQEDHVSMGSISATKALKVCKNLKYILGIELLNAAQAMEFRRPKKTSPLLENLLAEYRKEIQFVQDDVMMYPLIHKSIEFIENYDLPVFY